MKQVKHDNILPFYGVSATVSDFCLVFAWCENGNIMDYLKKKSDINRFDLASILNQIICSRRSPALTNSWWVRPMDCASFTKAVSFTAA